MQDKFKIALHEIAYAGKYYSPEQMIEIAKTALKWEPRNDNMNVPQIKERLRNGLFQTLNITEQDLFDIQFLINRVEEIVRINRGLSENYVEAEERMYALEDQLKRLSGYDCRNCSHQFRAPKQVHYGPELWQYVDCCPSCDSEQIEKNVK